MSILLDQCVPRRYLRLLQEWGYAASPLGHHAAIDSLDERVIAVAQSLDAVLLTVDLDFASILDYPPRGYNGIIVLRYRAVDEGALDITPCDNSLKIDIEMACGMFWPSSMLGAIVFVASGCHCRS